MSDQHLVQKLEQVWASLADLCSTFSEQDWKKATDCPGWSAQDHLSHLAGSEARYAGHAAPEHTPPHFDWVRNDIGERNEVVVDLRRPWPGERVFQEFKEVTGERLKTLQDMSPDEFSEKTQTPIGPGAVRDLLAIRVFDAWVHEQDIRRAVGRPGHMTGPVAEHSMGRVTMAMPFVVGKKAQAPDGSTVMFEITGPTAGTMAIGVSGGRAQEISSFTDGPTVHLTMDLETLSCLGCGRWEPGKALESGKVRIAGEQALGERIVAEMNFML